MRGETIGMGCIRQGQREGFAYIDVRILHTLQEMKRTLVFDFGVPCETLDGRSSNTFYGYKLNMFVRLAGAAVITT